MFGYVIYDGVPGEIRTPDRTLRRRMLYPAELLGHMYWSPFRIAMRFPQLPCAAGTQ